MLRKRQSSQSKSKQPLLPRHLHRILIALREVRAPRVLHILDPLAQLTLVCREVEVSDVIRVAGAYGLVVSVAHQRWEDVIGCISLLFNSISMTQSERVHFLPFTLLTHQF